MPDNIRERIEREAQGNFEPVAVRTVLKGIGSASRPVLVACEDDEQYVIKGSQNARMLYNEYVCGRLGNLIGAPVAWVRFVDIPVALRVGELAHFGPGLALGSLKVPKVSERSNIDHVNFPQNRAGFAGLAIMYTWCKANDHQLLYQEVPPHSVISNDHGHFFPGGPNWSPATLAGEGAVVRDAYFGPCGLTAADFIPYWPIVQSISDEEIRRVTNGAPVAWGVDQADRDALATYLVARRNHLQAAF
jgi:hypothetical protein